MGINPKYICKRAKKHFFLLFPPPFFFKEQPGILGVYFEIEIRMNGAYTKRGIAANRTSLYGIQQGNYSLKVEIYCSEVEGRVF